MISPDRAPGVYGVIEYRDWAQEYRIRTETDAGGSPPVPDGARISDSLTERAASKIIESGRYVGMHKGGYQTFLTLTLDRVSRVAVNRTRTDLCKCEGWYSIYPRPRKKNGGQPNPYRQPQRPNVDALPRTTIQRQVSRFFDGARKMHKRGWIDSKGRKVPEASSEFLYCWVAENPLNSAGERNPHIHVLMNWKVPFYLFQDWAARLESLWGQGFANLEKIRDSEAATGYLLKALKYMIKGAGDEKDQGPISGNRYAISQGAHAPGFVVIERRELRALGALIADISDHCQEIYQKPNAELRAAQEHAETVAGANRALRSQGRELSKERQKTTARAKRKLEKLRRAKKDRPIFATRYQLIVKGKDAYREVRAWLGTDHQWPAGVVPYLPEKPAGEKWDHTGKPVPADVEDLRKRIQWRVLAREAMRRRWTDREFSWCQEEYKQFESLMQSREMDDGSYEGWLHYEEQTFGGYAE